MLLRVSQMIMTAIILNSLSMMVEFYQQPRWWGTALSDSNYFFVFLFIAEAVMKVIAFGWQQYLNVRATPCPPPRCRRNELRSTRG